MARSTARRSSSGPKRRMFWARQSEEILYTSTNRASVTNLLNTFQVAYGADLFGFTVTRIVGNFSYYTPDAAVVTDSYILSTGIRAEDQSTVAAITTDAEQQTLNPIADPHADWMYASNHAGVLGPTGNIPAIENGQNRFEIDIRSQRRMDELGQSLYLFAGLNEDPGDAGDTVVFFYDLNILCKRP